MRKRWLGHVTLTTEKKDVYGNMVSGPVIEEVVT
jgi:hypothetical protein